ncbi:MAG TPA: hypothetical protein VH762_15070 [Gemmatimonadaceae bacterium]
MHPNASDLERFADGRVDRSRDSALIAHIETCAQCQADVERVRRAAASIALSSQPPVDLLARIKARRAAGERVELPVGAADESWADDVTIARDGHPALVHVHRIADSEYDADSDAMLVSHVRSCDSCQREVEEARHVTALLSLASRPPNELFEKIKTRRASGERVILPSVAAAVPTAAEISPASVRPLVVERRGGRRLPQWGLAIAATLLLAVAIGRQTWLRQQPDSLGQVPRDSATTGQTTVPLAVGTPKDSQSLGPGGIPLPSAMTLRNATDSAERAWLTLNPDTRRTRTLELKQSLMQLHSDFPALAAPRSAGDSLAIGLLDSVFDGATLSSVGRDATRQLAKVLARRVEYRVAIVRYSDRELTDSAADPLTVRAGVVRDALQIGGVAADRITLAASPYSVANTPDRARIEVVVLAPKPPPEIR